MKLTKKITPLAYVVILLGIIAMRSPAGFPIPKEIPISMIIASTTLIGAFHLAQAKIIIAYTVPAGISFILATTTLAHIPPTPGMFLFFTTYTLLTSASLAWVSRAKYPPKQPKQ